jgi:hypothetical protein
MPLTLRVAFTAGGTDSTLRVMNSVNDQLFVMRFNRQPSLLTFDPDNDIVLKQASTVVGNTLSAPTLVSPAANAIQQPTTLRFSWNATLSAATFRLQVATDSLFAGIVIDDSTITDTARTIGPLAEAGTFWWRVCGKNGGGIGPFAAPRKLSTITASTYTYTYADAWNLVSVPLRVSDRRKSSLYPVATSSAFAYDSTSGYVVYDTLRYGRGYWLKFSGVQDVPIAGFPRTRDTVDVAAGWNLIGMLTNPVAATAIEVLPPGILTTDFFGYEGLYARADTLQPGRGYWVKSVAPGKLVLSSPVARPVRPDRRTVQPGSIHRESVRPAVKKLTTQ